MDYKFILLLIVLVSVLLFIIKEMDTVKKDMDSKMTQIVTCIDNNSKLIRGKIQNDIGICIGKIKSLNCEYIEQVRKMNDYGSQPITNMSNHYTDSDTLDGKAKQPINYLSDAVDDIKKNNDSLYMSEDVPIISASKNPKLDSVKKISEKKISEISSKSSKSKSDDVKQFKIMYSDKKKSEKSSCETDSDKKSTSDGVSIEIDNGLVNNKKTSSSSSESSESSESSNSFEEMKESSEDEDDNESSSSSAINSSKYGSITLGSKKNGGGINVNKQIGIEKNDDNKSVSTHDMANLTVNTFESINKYNVDTLKQIAKRLSIPLTIKEHDGVQRRNLKKEEIYEKIKSMLEKN